MSILGRKISVKAVTALAAIMVVGALLPVLGFFAFRSELTSRERWLAVFVLAINPLIWRTSEYGNTAMIATTTNSSINVNACLRIGFIVGVKREQRTHRAALHTPAPAGACR